MIKKEKEEKISLIERIQIEMENEDTQLAISSALKEKAKQGNLEAIKMLLNVCG